MIAAKLFQSAYKKIFWNRIYPSEGFKEFVREVTEKKNQYKGELNTHVVENKENLTVYRRKNMSTFGHDDEDETTSYLSSDNDFDSDRVTREEGGRLS